MSDGLPEVRRLRRPASVQTVSSVFAPEWFPAYLLRAGSRLPERQSRIQRFTPVPARGGRIVVTARRT